MITIANDSSSLRCLIMNYLLLTRAAINWQLFGQSCPCDTTVEVTGLHRIPDMPSFTMLLMCIYWRGVREVNLQISGRIIPTG